MSPTAAPPKGAAAAPSINVYKKVVIVRNPDDTMSFQDEAGNLKSLSAQELGEALVMEVRCAS